MSQLFRQESLDHKRRKLFGDVILVQPLSFVLVTVAFAVLIGLAVWFFATREYVRKETVAGFITPSSGVTTIRAERGGRLLQRYGSVGARVAQGDILFESEIDIETSDGFVSQRQFESATERLAELEAQLGTTRQRYRTDRLRLTSQIKNIEAELGGLNRRLGLQIEATEFSSARREKMDRLLAEEVASLLEAEQARSDDINQNLSLELIRQQIVSREGALLEAQFALDALPAAQDRELSQLRQQIAQIDETRTALQGASRYQVRSPVSGTITAVQGNIGQTLSPNTPVFVIVPDNAEMIATLLIPTRAAGFVEVGQSVNLLVDAFPYQKFGVQGGRVSEISRTPFRPGELNAPIAFDQPVYRIKVDLVKETVTAYG
ncbi:MAG: HlyD family efflux transporter periplasmic adaptor subunit, partial [Pseudomonadota bacterium]